MIDELVCFFGWVCVWIYWFVVDCDEVVVYYWCGFGVVYVVCG